MSASQSPMNWPYNLSASVRSEAGPFACKAAIKPEDFSSDTCASPGLHTGAESASNVAIKPEDFEYDIGNLAEIACRRESKRQRSPLGENCYFDLESGRRSAAAGLFQLDSGHPDDLEPARRVLGQQRREILRCAAARLDAEAGKARQEFR